MERKGKENRVWTREKENGKGENDDLLERVRIKRERGREWRVGERRCGVSEERRDDEHEHRHQSLEVGESKLNNPSRGLATVH